MSKVQCPRCRLTRIQNNVAKKTLDIGLNIHFFQKLASEENYAYLHFPCALDATRSSER